MQTKSVAMTGDPHRPGMRARSFLMGSAALCLFMGNSGGIALAGSSGTYLQQPSSGSTTNSVNPNASSSIAIGVNATAPTTNSQGNAIGSGDQISIGTDTLAGNQDAIAIGAQTQALGVGSIALGNNVSGGALNATVASGNYSMAFGVNSTSTGLGSLTFGGFSNASSDYGIALGTGSQATRAALNGANEAFSNQSVSSPFGALSIGSAGHERQIVNVAGGTQDTDAVNVRQLRAVGSQLAGSLGGGAAYDSTTDAYTTPVFTYAGQNYSTVAAAIASADALGVKYTPDGSGAATNAIDLTKGGALAAVSITGLAAATTGSGAVNLSQLPMQYSTSAAPTTANPATPSNDVTLIGTSGQPVTLHNVAAGAITSSSTDAVNGSQIRGAVSSIATGLGGGATVNNDGTVSAPRYTVKGSHYSNVGGAIGGLNSAVTSLDSLGVQYTPDGSGNATNAVDLTRGGALAPVAVSGVAAGALTATSTDAVNGTQLYTTNQDLQSLRGSLSDGTIGLVQQDASSHNITVGSATNGTVVNFDNSTGTARTLQGVANGQIAAASTQAVNGSQVYGAAASIASRLGGGTTVNSDGTLSAPTYTVKGTNYSNVGGAIGGLNSAVTAFGSLGVEYTADGSGNATNAIDLTRGGTLAPVAVSGVAAGALTAASTDAVNGAQLYATNQDVLSLRNTLTDGTVGLVQQDPTSHDITVGAGTNGTVVTFDNTAGAARTLKGVAAGQIAAGSTQGVDGGQVYGVAASLATDLGGGATVNSDGTLSAPTYTVKGTHYSNVGGAIGGLDTAVTSLASLGVQYTPDGRGNPTNAVDLTRGGTLKPVSVTGVAAGALTATSTAAVNGAQLYTTNQDITSLRGSIANGTVGLVQQNPTSRTINVGATTDGTTVDFANKSGASRTLEGVANGQIATGSSQAVNGGQVYNIASSIAQNLGGGVTVRSDGTLSAPSYSVQGSTYSSVGSAIGGLDSAIDAVNTKGTRYVAVNSTGAAASAAGKDTVAIGPNATASADGGVALGANADATRSGMGGKTELFSGTGVASTEGAISVGATGAERQITNVAGGTQDTDAVNIRQLKAVGSQVATVLGGGAALNADGTLKAPSYRVDGTVYGTVGGAVAALDTTGVKYDIDPSTGGRGQSVTLAGGDPDQPVLVRNVATGRAATDAANTGQVAAAQAAAFSYTDQQVAGVEQQIGGIDNRLAGMQSEITQSNREAHQGAAIGLAAASLRFDDRPGKLSAAIGGGYWKGEAATAMGFGYSLPDSSTRLNATATTTGTDFGIAAGASFTLN